MNEERDNDEDKEEGEAGGEGAVEEDKVQAEVIELSRSEVSHTQKTSEKIIDERRVFTIPRPPVLQRSPIKGASRTDGR